MEKPNCILCGGSTEHTFWREGGHEVVVCSICGVQQIVHKETLKELEVLEDEYYQSKTRKKLDGFDRHTRWDREAQVINALRPDGGTLLDIGCGNGSFLKELDGRWETLGIEPHNERAELARNKGLEILNVEFHEADLTQKFDVITLYEVVEHLIEFDTTMDGIGSILRKGGLFVLSTPDTESVSARVKGLNWWSYANPVHLFFFGHKNLTEILKTRGFRVLLKRYNLQGNQFQNPFLKRLQFLLEDNLPFYRRLPIGDRMFMYCGKALNR